jgi:hypothetical protein
LQRDFRPWGQSVQKEEIDVPQAWGVLWWVHIVGGLGVCVFVCDERESRVRYLSFFFVLVLEREENNGSVDVDKGNKTIDRGFTSWACEFIFVSL